ncbi:Similar to Dgkq: Diacylglycerol kinase theta (Rattus norvegicus) [Cotesia congregata]|uniref:Diacylglycerol kinase n=1 Tax=Cotesia congregata TaxID=51543 RepID=A0A8J2HSV3_COTCN|nr:Similar to Dgkq: Diacylglycerol kinase theta (Rattus norvegicus) [Cotesia congregata]
MASTSAKTPASHGHSFRQKTFHKPTFCHSCTDRLWGIIGQGNYICEVCNFMVHERCLTAVVSPCSSIAANLIKNPVAHCWSEPVHHKKKFCNVCRKRLEDTSPSVHCEICEYFVHTDCQDFALADCKENATYLPGKDLSSVTHTHHWREGNLPTNSKCAVCKKGCCSTECLSGFRCEWCGMTLHSYCRKSPAVRQECTFGSLEPIYLPPYAISIPRSDVPMEAIIGVHSRRREISTHNTGEQFDFAESERIGATGHLAEAFRRLSLVFPRSCHGNCHASPPYVRARSISEEFSSGDTKNRDSDDAMQPSTGHNRDPKSPKDKDDKERGDEEMIKVYDGNLSLKRKIFRVISVPRQASTAEVLAAALKAYHITEVHLSSFYLTDLYAPEETRLCDPTPVLNLHRKEGKRRGVFLRHRDQLSSEVRVYPGKLNVLQTYCTVTINEETTVADLMSEALVQFNQPNANIEDYRCSEVLMDRDERVMDTAEKPLEILKQLGKDSIRQRELMRFYLQLKQDPHGSNVALYVANLPASLNEKLYENILIDFLGIENKFKSIGPIYYEHGCMVIIYEDLEKAVRALYILRESKYEDKNLLVMLLPSIEPTMIPAGVQPLLVFVNVKSGGCQGHELVTSFRKLLNPYQVFDLDNGGPLPGMYMFRHIRNYKILVCGGDGTIGWVLQCLDNVGQDSECSSPACAIVPLGTGNDLARVLCWGPGYTGGEDPINLLRDVIDAEEIMLDRWTVVFHPQDQDDATGAGSTSEDNAQMFVMNNYFGLGIDADLCLGFHNAREENPDKFNSRLHNKGVYVKMGVKKMLDKTCRDMQRKIRLEVDNKVIDLPPLEGMIILNIQSWGSGAKPWGDGPDDQFRKPNHYDGLLEVVGVTGVAHLGQIQSGFRSAMRIAQGGHIKIHLSSDVPVQVDGEPWTQTPSVVVILKSALKAAMLKKTKGKVKRRDTDANMPSTGPQPSTSNDPTDPEVF